MFIMCSAIELLGGVLGRKRPSRFNRPSALCGRGCGAAWRARALAACAKCPWTHGGKNARICSHVKPGAGKGIIIALARSRLSSFKLNHYTHQWSLNIFVCLRAIRGFATGALGHRSAAACAFDVGFEVSQVFVQALFGVAKQVGNELADLASRWYILKQNRDLGLLL
jgi:hypothetical protein